jgi:gamma-glutamyltranspeptidase/glutathione hydrolase
MAPAIRLARDGFVLTQGDVDLISIVARDLAEDPPSARCSFATASRPRRQRLVQKDLARTLEHVAKRGSAGFYAGPSPTPSSPRARAAAASSSSKTSPLPAEGAHADRMRLPRLQIVSAPPPSSGGVVLCEILGRARRLSAEGMGLPFGARLASPDRGDAPRLCRSQQLPRRSGFRPQSGRTAARQGVRREAPCGNRSAKAGASRDLKPGVAPHEGVNTTHYSIVDKDGNAVAVTYTLNEWFGARVMPAGTGIILNDEMDDFTAKLGVANLYGLVQGEANAIAPGKRPLSSMSPTIVLKDGKPVLVIGTPGGSRIITVVLQVIVNTIDYGWICRRRSTRRASTSNGCRRRRSSSRSR